MVLPVSLLLFWLEAQASRILAASIPPERNEDGLLL